MRRPSGFSGLFVTEHRARCAYAEAAGPYRIVPEAVALPRDVEDVTRLVHAATEDGWTLIPRAAGSGMPGGNVGPGVIVDVQNLRHPFELHPETMDALVGTAVTWRQLDTAAGDVGLRLPPDPSSGAFCTLGGMVATNAAGSRSVRYGSIRPWVTSIDMVTGRGESIRLTRSARPQPSLPEAFAAMDQEIRDHARAIRDRFPRTRKNSSGYALDVYLESGDMIDLIVGSEGTLGIITEIGLRLAPRAPAVAGLLVTLPDIAVLTEAIRTLLPFRPAALELLDRSFVQIAAQDRSLHLADSAAVLLVDFEGTAAEVMEAARSASGAISRIAAHTRTALDDDQHAELWALRHAASPVLARLPDTRRSLQVIEDGCVPIDRLSDYLTGVHRVAADVGVEIVAFGHAGDGHLHVNALADTTDPRCETRLEELLERTTELVLELGGTPSGEHGDGRLRSQAVARLYGPDLLQLFGRIKRAFDPSAVLNPGVIVPEGGPPMDRLKVGIRAAPIPDDIAMAMRDVERTGEWGIPRLELPCGPQSR